MKPRTRACLDRRRAGGARRRRRARAQRVPLEPRVLLHADAGRSRTRRRRDGRSASAAWSTPAASRATPTPSPCASRDRHRADDARDVYGTPAGPLQGRQGRRRARTLGADGVFHATEVLAKHDENYMPPEAADAIEKRAERKSCRAPQWPRPTLVSARRSDSIAHGPRTEERLIPELGHFALILALLVAIGRRAAHAGCGARRDGALMAIARPGRDASQFLLVAFAFGCLASASSASDFSVHNVARAFQLDACPAHYRFAATWGSHEGSLLLWIADARRLGGRRGDAGRNLPRCCARACSR